MGGAPRGEVGVQAGRGTSGEVWRGPPDCLPPRPKQLVHGRGIIAPRRTYPARAPRAPPPCDPPVPARPGGRVRVPSDRRSLPPAPRWRWWRETPVVRSLDPADHGRACRGRARAAPPRAREPPACSSFAKRDDVACDDVACATLTREEASKRAWLERLDAPTWAKTASPAPLAALSQPTPGMLMATHHGACGAHHGAAPMAPMAPMVPMPMRPQEMLQETLPRGRGPRARGPRAPWPPWRRPPPPACPERRGRRPSARRARASPSRPACRVPSMRSSARRPCARSRRSPGRRRARTTGVAAHHSLRSRCPPGTH